MIIQRLVLLSSCVSILEGSSQSASIIQKREETEKGHRRSYTPGTIEEHLKTAHHWDFPGGAVVKNLPASAGDTGSSPGLGRSHMPPSN